MACVSNSILGWGSFANALWDIYGRDANDARLSQTVGRPCPDPVVPLAIACHAVKGEGNLFRGVRHERKGQAGMTAFIL
jgi:hypothetical protein